MHALRNILKPTPIARLQMPGIELYAKLEYFNPAGSVKDRIAKYMIEDAEKRGEGMEAALAKALNRFESRADRRVDEFQDQFSGSAEQVSRNLSEAGETLELRLERQIERVLVNLGIPTRDRLERLNQEIDRLNAKLDEELARQHSAGA